MSPFEPFDHVYVISHPITGREPAMYDKLLQLGVQDPQFIHARRPAAGFNMSNMRRNSQGEFGCSLSHAKALYQASKEAQQPLFLEDDVEFADYLEPVLQAALSELPLSWALLYLGGHPCEDVQPAGEHLVRVGRFSFAEAYAINQWALDLLLEHWFDRQGQPDAMFDRILGEFAQLVPAFAVYPPVTFQPAGYSHVADKDDDKSHCVESGWANHLHR